MRKIRLSDTDLELFDIEILPSDFTFYQKHKDAFRTMWREQGKPFWTRYVITFRSFTVKHGVIKQMNIDSPKFENLIDQAFIFIHEQFVDGKEKMAKNFLEDIARLAQNQDKFPALDSKSFARDPFYLRETRELFRSFFGMPDQKSSYLKVYILCPVFMRFGGSVCKCLERWLVAPVQDDPTDDSYWIPPQPQMKDKIEHSNCVHEIIMCEKCIDDCGDKFFNEKILGRPNGPLFLDCWKLGDPRFNDRDNPLFAPHMDPLSDWRATLTVESFREFLFYAKSKYGSPEDKCVVCNELRKDQVLKLTAAECRKKTKKGDEREVDLTQIKEFRILKDLGHFKEIDFKHCTEETALDLGTKLLNFAKDTIPTDNPATQDLVEIEAELNAKIAKKEKKKRRKANKAQAQKKESSPSPERNLENGSDKEETTVGAFKVERDEKKGIVSVTVTTSEDNKGTKNGLLQSKAKGLPDGVSLTYDLIREQISGLPWHFEFWEGAGYLIAVLNYEEEEKDLCENPTNFTIKVSGVNDKLHENIIVKLLFYVQKRKKRKALGWTMDADDVIACIMPDEDPELSGLEVDIYGGRFFKAKLTKKERATLKQSLPTKKILMMLEPKVAQEIRASENGKERLMDIISKVCRNDSKKERMFRCNDLWDKLLSNPDKFDFVLTVNSQRAEELSKIGLKPLDIGYEEFMEMQCPSVKLCRHCCRMRHQCDCKLGPDDDSETSGNFMKLITGDQFHVLGGWSGNNGKEEEEKERPIKLHEIDNDFLNSKLAELRKQNAGTHDPLTGLSKKLTYQSPTPQNATPVPEMTRTINLCISSKDKEENVCIKLEAFMPEDKSKAGRQTKSSEDVLREIKEEFEKNLTPEEAKVMNSLDIKHLIEGVPGSESVYCPKHQQAYIVPPDGNPSSVTSPPAAHKISTMLKIHKGKGSPSANGNTTFKQDDRMKSQPANGNTPFKQDDRTKSQPANQTTFLPSATKEDNSKVSAGKNETQLTNGKKEQSAQKTELKKSGKESSAKLVDDKLSLRICGHCGKEEPKRKAFKKCQKCKEEGVKNVRYYCGRDCQVEDWKNKHKTEHRDGLLI